MHKRLSRANPGNYRGIHLTAQVSKLVERILSYFFKPCFEATGAFGPRQFAYTTGIGHRDALAVNTLMWLSSLEDGFAIGLYLSDVSAAFDRVPAERLLRQLVATGAHPRLVTLMQSWLHDRKPLSS